MRFGIVFALTHDGEVEIVSGPGNPTELNKDLKKSVAGVRVHPKYAELHLHEIQLSNGRKRFSFSAPKIETESGQTLDDLKIKELHDLGDEEGVNLTGCEHKQDYVDRIRAYREIAAKRKLSDLKQLAAEEQVDVSDCKLKKDFVNAIAAARRERAASTT